MSFLFLLISLFSAFTAMAGDTHNIIKIAIIDSGLDLTDFRFQDHLCPKGHKDFTNLGLEDTNSHGTNIAGLIEQYAGSGNYCFLIYKYYDDSFPDYINTRNEIWSIREAIKNKADIVNISGGGTEFSEDEYLLIKDNKRVKFVVAAGNLNKNIETKDGRFYPASLFLPNMQIVGSINSEGKKSNFSNWANKAIYWEMGENVPVMSPNYGYTFVSGTSESCAIHTGKLVREILNAAE